MPWPGTKLGMSEFLCADSGDEHIEQNGRVVSERNETVL